MRIDQFAVKARSPLSSRAIALTISTLCVIAILWFISMFGVNVPVSDDWRLVRFFYAVQQGNLSLGWLWEQASEHRMVFPRLIFMGLAFASQWNLKVQMYASVLLVVLTLLVFNRLTNLTHSREQHRPFLYRFNAIALFSFVQYDNWLGGFQLAWFLIDLCLAIAVLLIVCAQAHPPTHDWAAIPCLIAVGFAQSYFSMDTSYTQIYQIPEFDRLEIFRVQSVTHHYPRHAHPTYSVGVISAGTCCSFYRGTLHHASPNSLVLINPDEPHSCHVLEQQPMSYWMLYPSLTLMQEFVDQAYRGTPTFTTPLVLDGAIAHSLQTLCYHLARTCENALAHSAPLADQLTMQTRFVELFTGLIDRFVKPISIAPLSPNHKAIQLIRDYLHDNLEHSISLQQLAMLTQLNRSYLVRLFRSTVGIPPYAYLTQIRLERARQLLIRGQTVAEVAIAVGMADQSHLNRHFKRVFGITPGQYRQMAMRSVSG